MAPDTTSAPWSFFDRIYCINLMQRPDRRVQAAAQFAQVGLADRVTYVTVERHPTDCEQGIYESHMACLRQGLADGARRVLIFEDDIVFENYRASRFSAALDFLSQRPDWQILFLGCLVKSSRGTETAVVRKISYRCLAHAYAVNRDCAQAIVEKPWQGIPFDAMLTGFENGIYACYPSFAFQDGSASDNWRHPRLDAFRRRCGGLKRIQKLNEWYHRHALVLMAAHLAVLTLLLWLIANK
jgi:hypothetical protein